MIDLVGVCKRFVGLQEEKAVGVALWVKNLARLTSNQASQTLALDGVTVSVGRGEVFGVFGANGAGKTTLIKVLSGLLAPTSGQVTVNGHTDIRQIKGTISYVSTNGWMGLEWQLTARENLVLYGNIFGLSGKTLTDRCDAALKTVGVADAGHKYVSQLSAGMRQKVTIARGLVLDRPVVYYDEPSVSLDVQSARALRDLIRTDADQHRRTAIIASHSPEDLAVCDRIMLLSHGRILAVGTPAELRAPLAGRRIIEVTFPNVGSDPGFGSLPGVETVAWDDAPGQSGLRQARLTVAQAGFCFDDLADLLITYGIAAHAINEVEVSLAEVYAHYVAVADATGPAADGVAHES